MIDGTAGIALAAALFGLAAIGLCFVLVVRWIERGRKRLEANIETLGRMTQSVKQADRQRVLRAVSEERRLVQKLRVAMDDTASARERGG